MLENLKEVILNLEKSLNMMVQDEEVELLKHPEYLQAMKEVVQSISQVTRTLKSLEEGYSEGRELDRKKQAETAQARKKLGEACTKGNEQDKEVRVEEKKASESGNRVLKVVKKKSDTRRTSSN